jgi:hypothetical protein
MIVEPAVLTKHEVCSSDQHSCPLCKVENTASDYDIGWVICPMVNHKPICRGCCFDYQSIARSPEYLTHPYRDDFEGLAKMVDNEVADVRLVCLQHQEVILTEDLTQPRNLDLRSQTEQQLKEIKKMIKHLNEEICTSASLMR